MSVIFSSELIKKWYSIWANITIDQKPSTFSQPHDKITVRHIFVHVPRSHFFIKPHKFFRKIINFNYFLNNDFLLCYFFPFIYFIQSYFLCIFFIYSREREKRWINGITTKIYVRWLVQFYGLLICSLLFQLFIQ